MRLLFVIARVLALHGRTSGTAAEPQPPGAPATAPLVALSWRDDSYGALGDGGEADESSDVAGPVAGPAGTGVLDDVVAVTAGEYFAVALATDGTVWSWGRNNEGQLGNDGMGTNQDTPVQVVNADATGFLDHVVSIASGTYHTLALRDDGTLWAWGYAGFGRLGDGQEGIDRDRPVQVWDPTFGGYLEDVVAIAAGYDHSLAMTADGAIYAWGSNAHDQLGQGPGSGMDLSMVPVRVKDAAGTGFLGGVRSLYANSYTSYALATDGTVWSWGNNDEGEIGDGTIAQRPLPVKVKTPDGTGVLGNVKEISSGSYHALTTLTNGTPLAWGYNLDGQIGDGDLGNDSLLPANVRTPSGSLSGVVTMSGGYDFSLAVRNDGSAWSWGDDFHGQLGNGGLTGVRDEAGQVLGESGPLTSVVDVTAGIDGVASYALGRTATATLKAPAATRTAAVAVAMAGASVFGIDGYFIGESPVAPLASSSAWLPTPPVAYTIQAPGDGAKTLYAFTRDTEGYVSPAATATVRLDATVPAIAFDLPPFTRSKQTGVTLKGFDAGGVAGYMIRASAARPSASASGWQTTAPKSFALAGADGTKKLYAWVKDSAGNVSLTKSDTTLLDTKRPGVTISGPARGAELRRLRAISGRTTDVKPGSGVKTQRAAIQRKQGAVCSWWDVKTEKLVAGQCRRPRWFAIPSRLRWTKEIGELAAGGAYTLYVEATDRALNRQRAARKFTVAPG